MKRLSGNQPVPTLLSQILGLGIPDCRRLIQGKTSLGSEQWQLLVEWVRQRGQGNLLLADAVRNFENSDAFLRPFKDDALPPAARRGRKPKALSQTKEPPSTPEQQSSPESSTVPSPIPSPMPQAARKGQAPKRTIMIDGVTIEFDRKQDFRIVFKDGDFSVSIGR